MAAAERLMLRFRIALQEGLMSFAPGKRATVRVYPRSINRTARPMNCSIDPGVKRTTSRAIIDANIDARISLGTNLTELIYPPYYKPKLDYPQIEDKGLLIKPFCMV
jgi:hypothetical protein